MFPSIQGDGRILFVGEPEALESLLEPLYALLDFPVQGGVEQTTERMVAYVQALYPVLPEYLPN